MREPIFLAIKISIIVMNGQLNITQAHLRYKCATARADSVIGREINELSVSAPTMALLGITYHRIDAYYIVVSCLEFAIIFQWVGISVRPWNVRQKGLLTVQNR